MGKRKKEKGKKGKKGKKRKKHNTRCCLECAYTNNMFATLGSLVIAKVAALRFWRSLLPLEYALLLWWEFGCVGPWCTPARAVCFLVLPTLLTTPLTYYLLYGAIGGPCDIYPSIQCDHQV